MKELLSIEKKLNILFPQSYKNTLDKFKLFMEIEFKDYEIDLFNNNLLFDELNSFPRWNYMEYLVEINKKKQKAENIVQRHDSTEFVDSERVKKGFMFGSSSDGGRLYFDLNDNLSIWEYWLDDGSIGKVADTFDEILLVNIDFSKLHEVCRSSIWILIHVLLVVLQSFVFIAQLLVSCLLYTSRSRAQEM